MNNQAITVWDPFIRLFHWSLVVSFAVAWLTSDDGADLHHWAGYAAALLITARIIWGFIGSPYARFRQFVRRPSEVLQFSKQMLLHDEPRYIGHNPAGSLMILGLIITLGITALTGWMYTTDAFWGEDWVEETHEIMANLMLMMVIIHVAGVIYASRTHGENLVKSMINGKKRAPETGDIA